MSDLITIVVPIYNVEKYLEKCIKSILEQTYKNLEVILVDDGSPDQCGEICDRYAEQDERIKVIHKINGGLSDARNAGIDMATGTYIGFVDSDDYIQPGMIEQLYRMITEKKSDIAVCNFRYVNENDEAEYINELTGEDQWRVISGRDAQFQYFDKDKRIIFTVAWNKLYRIELFQNLRYPKGKVHEDEFTTFKLLYQAKHIVVAKDRLYNYLVREQSIMGQFSKRRFDLLEAYREKMRFYVEQEEKDLYNKSLQIYMRMTAQYMNWITENDTGCKQIAMNQRKEFTQMYKQTKKKMEVPILTRLESALFTHWLNGYMLLWKFVRRGR